MSSIACTVCSEAGHHMRRCPTLASPLQSGFYAPPAGARQGGGDDDDEKAKIESPVYPVLSRTPRKCQNQKNNHKQRLL